MNLGFIGTGNMGARFVPRLIAAGHTVSIFDTRLEAMTNLVLEGAIQSESAKQVASEADAVFVSLPNPAIVEKVALDENAGVIHALPKGSAFVDMSTSPPSLARKISEKCNEIGVFGIDAPVSNGGIFVTIGGSKSIVDKLWPAFEAMCEKVIYMGPSGQGQIAKLCRQYVSYTAFFTLIEALLIGHKSEVDTQKLANFIGESTGNSGPGQSLKRLAERDFGSPESARAKLDIVAKDLGMAVELAELIDSPHGTGTVTSDTLKAAQEKGWGEWEYWISACILEEISGKKIEFPSL